MTICGNQVLCDGCDSPNVVVSRAEGSIGRVHWYCKACARLNGSLDDPNKKAPAIAAESDLLRSLDTGLENRPPHDEPVMFNARFPGGVWQHCPAFIAHEASSPRPDTSVYLRICQCEYHQELRALLKRHKIHKSGPRLYQRVIHRCGECHSFCAGTQFRASTCAKTGSAVTESGEPPENCPLPYRDN